jgi:hypothetical protein
MKLSCHRFGTIIHAAFTTVSLIASAITGLWRKSILLIACTTLATTKMSARGRVAALGVSAPIRARISMPLVDYDGKAIAIFDRRRHGLAKGGHGSDKILPKGIPAIRWRLGES